MQLRNRTCGGCNKVFEVASGKVIPSANPKFYQQRGLCEECFGDVKEVVTKIEEKVCKDVAWATR